MANSKTAFITGVAGFLGSHFAEKLLAQGWNVAGCDDLSGGYADSVPDGVVFSPDDCVDLELMRKAIGKADVVYHCAATPHEGLSVFSPRLMTRNTIYATSSVVSAAVSNGVSRFIYCSSMARYGENLIPFTEDMAPDPLTPYGIGKVAGELLLRSVAETHGMEYVIAVPHNIYGPRQKYDDPYRNVAAIMINRMMTGQQPIIYGDGSQRRCFSFIEDDAKILVQLATTDHPDIVNDIVNVGPDEEFISINALAEMIAHVVGFELDPQYMPARPLEVQDATCSADKARAALGYRTEYTLRRGLEEMAEWMRERGPRPFDYYLDVEIVNGSTPKAWVDRLL